MSASDYPINFPYGATVSPYSAAHPHRGDDRACPEGTPIVINGITIGLTGETGFVEGAHLHIQEWSGDYSNTRKPQNAFKGGRIVNIDPAGTQGDGSFGKFITIQTPDGWNDSYCHLSEINVAVGQVIGDNEMSTVSDTEIDQMSWAYFGYGASQEFIDEHRGTESNTFERFMFAHPVAVKYRADRDGLQKTVDSLTQANLKLTDQLKSKPVPTSDPNSVTITKDGFWASLLRFLGKG
jgi:hypothetical protein